MVKNQIPVVLSVLGQLILKVFSEGGGGGTREGHGRSEKGELMGHVPLLSFQIYHLKTFPQDLF